MLIYHLLERMSFLVILKGLVFIFLLSDRTLIIVSTAIDVC